MANCGRKRRASSAARRGERVYTARQNDNAETIVAFGDGRTGARLPSGAMNVTARYRTGLGLEGLMKPDQLSIPLERPVGLRAVSNPLPADGAADPETRDDARDGRAELRDAPSAAPCRSPTSSRSPPLGPRRTGAS